MSVRRALVEHRKTVLEGVVERVAWCAVRIGDAANEVLRPGQRAGVNGVLHQPALEVEATGVDGQSQHAADPDHG